MQAVSSPASVNWSRSLVAPALVCAAICGGCATVASTDPRDPLESFNRGVFGFNDALDKAILRPAAVVYRGVVPQPVRFGISNFLGNLEDVWSFVNDLLQFRGQAAASAFMRFNVNTVMGLGGVLDVASAIGLERRDNDFGQTLGRWGMASGPYLMLPLIGPSTMRDLVGLPVDAQGYLISRIRDVPVRNTLEVLDQLDTRADLLEVEETVNAVAFDRYSFIRDVYLQRRRNALYDGEPPPEEAPVAPDPR